MIGRSEWSVDGSLAASVAVGTHCPQAVAGRVARAVGTSAQVGPITEKTHPSQKICGTWRTAQVLLQMFIQCLYTRFYNVLLYKRIHKCLYRCFHNASTMFPQRFPKCFTNVPTHVSYNVSKAYKIINNLSLGHPYCSTCKNILYTVCPCVIYTAQVQA